MFTERVGEGLEQQHAAHHPVEPSRPPKAWDFSLPDRDGERFAGTAAYVGLGALAVPTLGADGAREWKMLSVGVLYDPRKEHTVYLTGFDQKRVAEHFNIKLSDMHSARRARAVARPRQVAMYLAKQLTSRSLPEIGRKFGGRDHTTVMHAVRKIEELRALDSSFSEDVELLRRMLES